MQPYFLPYIGYFQLIAAVDRFVVYDNIKYTKKGWINRNRFLQNGSDAIFSLPLKKDSDFLDVRDRNLASDFQPGKLLAQLTGAYSRAPQFERVVPLLERVLLHRETNLFRYIHHSIREVCTFIGIRTEIVVSSEIPADPTLKGQDRVLSICHAVGATTYLNAIGGVELYSKDAFRAKGIELAFIKSAMIEYPQFGSPFVPWLSIIDVLMFNSTDQTREYLGSFELL